MELDLLSDERQLREANRTAVLLAKARYDQLLAPFVKGSAARFAYVKDELDRIVRECSEQTGADVNFVDLALRRILAEVVLPVTQPTHEDFPGTQEKQGLPPEGEGDDPEPEATTSVLDHEPVLVEEITNPGKLIDVQGCFRCEASSTENQLVCDQCASELKIAAGFEDQNMAPRDQNAIMECTLCQADGYRFTGTADQVEAHIKSAHADELREDANQSPPQQPYAAKRQSPQEKFDVTIQELANKAAALKFSSPQDIELRFIAARYRLDVDEVAENLRVLSAFGPWIGRNGEVTSDGDLDSALTEMEDFSELEIRGIGGRIESFEVNVPSDVAVRRVAEDLGLEYDHVYSSIQDHYGTGLTDQYTASVTGEHYFFLPSDLLKRGNQGPAVTLRDIQETERRAEQRKRRAAGMRL